MARALILLPPAVTSLEVAGRPLSDHFAWLGERIGLETTVVDPTRGHPHAGRALLIDGMFPALSAGSLHTLVDALRHDGGVLLAPHGAVLAAAVPRVPSDRPLADVLGQAVGSAEQVVARDEALAVDPHPGPAEAVIRRRWQQTLAEGGVRFVDPDRILVDTTVSIGAHSTVWPGCVLRGSTRIGRGVQVQAGAWLEDTEVADDALIRPYTVATGATIGPGAQVGPFAHLRQGAVLEASTRVGNYVEVKKATLRQGAKASHLAYLGDAEIGAGANIGAGTITCNYDGFAKHRTVIGPGAFIGSNTALVAPVEVGAQAIVGAGSVVVRDVPDDALYVERATPKVLEGRASSIRRRNELRAERSEDA